MAAGGRGFQSVGHGGVIAEWGLGGRRDLRPRIKNIILDNCGKLWS
jgi:hypothetical protein